MAFDPCYQLDWNGLEQHLRSGLAVILHPKIRIENLKVNNEPYLYVDGDNDDISKVVMQFGTLSGLEGVSTWARLRRAVGLSSAAIGEPLEVKLEDTIELV
uniref:Uncharacterized protein n=1 Tax=Ananas comosus var. bracteatus TaxID=296719 RepID=A0A6V7QM82_ANACO|nr:unnamed protein product [Ananas comosus var. bracteatus]